MSFQSYCVYKEKFKSYFVAYEIIVFSDHFLKMYLQFFFFSNSSFYLNSAVNKVQS